MRFVSAIFLCSTLNAFSREYNIIISLGNSLFHFVVYFRLCTSKLSQYLFLILLFCVFILARFITSFGCKTDDFNSAQKERLEIVQNAIFPRCCVLWNALVVVTMLKIWCNNPKFNRFFLNRFSECVRFDK